jgi:hypothetical protein
MKHTRTCALVVVGTALAAGSAAAQEGQERRPLIEETLTPVTVKQTAAQTAPSADAAAQMKIRQQPPFTPLGRMDSEEMLAIKRQASGDQRIQPADQVLPLSAPEAAARVTESFRGININEAGVGDFIFAPPDPNVAASPERVVHVVNLAIRMFTRSGGELQTLNLNDFFDTPVAENGVSSLSDPKIIYDVNGPRHRFYITAIESNVVSGTLPNFSRIHLAVSRSANPSNLNPGNWCHYRIDARLNRGTNLVNWADFPSIGAGEDALVITTNQFTFNDFSFVTAAIWALRKLPLSNNAESCPSSKLFTFRASDEVGDPRAFTVQPVQHLTAPSSFAGTGNPVYLVNTISTATTSVPSKDYRVYRLRNVATTPTLSRATVTGNYAYFVPPNVGQDNEAGFIFTNDERVEEAAGVGDAFWATHATACSFSTGNVSCARVIRVRVGQSSSGALQASITQQKTFGAPDDFLFEPGLAVNRDETVAVPFHYASPDRTDNNLSTWWAVKANDEADFSSFSLLATGSCQQVTPRTGDYSGAETDPVDLKSFWLAGEAARPIVPFGGACFWVTRIIQVTPAGAAAVATASSSGE